MVEKKSAGTEGALDNEALRNGATRKIRWTPEGEDTKLMARIEQLKSELGITFRSHTEKSQRGRSSQKEELHEFLCRSLEEECAPEVRRIAGEINRLALLMFHESGKTREGFQAHFRAGLKAGVRPFIDPQDQRTIDTVIDALENPEDLFSILRSEAGKEWDSLVLRTQTRKRILEQESQLKASVIDPVWKKNREFRATQEKKWMGERSGIEASVQRIARVLKESRNDLLRESIPFDEVRTVLLSLRSLFLNEILRFAGVAHDGFSAKSGAIFSTREEAESHIRNRILFQLTDIILLDACDGEDPFLGTRLELESPDR